jgi:6-phospho-beta-glucosidase
VKLAIVGAGSSYTPEIVAGLLAHTHEQIPVDELALFDVNPERLATMAGLTRRMIGAAAGTMDVRVAEELAESIDGAQFVVTQIRVGGMDGRHVDESVPLRYGVIGQETTGPGGMAKALRTIPAMIRIAEEVARSAPEATILNYTNPSGVITEAVLRHTRAKIVGLCSGLPGVQAWLAPMLTERFGAVRFRAVGLNHVGFIHQVLAGDGDVTSAAIEEVARQLKEGSESLRRWVELAQTLGAFPMPGYSEYYFRRAATLARQKSAESTRAQDVMRIERDLFAQAADPALAAPPPALLKRGGGGYSSVTFGVLMSMLGTAPPSDVIVSTRNGDTVHGLPPDCAVEVACQVSPSGIRAHPVGDIPLAFRGLVQTVKSHEILTIEAAVTRSRERALQAMLAHPLSMDLDAAVPMLDELLAAHELDFH